MSAPQATPRETLAQLQDAMVSSILSGGPLATDDLAMSATESAVYRRNIELMARNALAVSYPTVARLLGRERFTEVAGLLLHQHPPATGDWGTWGRHLPRVLGRSRAAGAFPFLVPAARLDWRTHVAGRSDDNVFHSDSLALLEAIDLAELTIELADHCSLLSSRYPLLEIREWDENHADPPGITRVADAPRRLLVFRPQYRVEALYLTEADYQFFLNMKRGRSIGGMLEALQEQGFDLPQWIDFAIRNNLIHQFRQREKGATP